MNAKSPLFLCGLVAALVSAAILRAQPAPAATPVIRVNAAATKPFGFKAFYPGPGIGGHCIPVDPFYLTWVARQFGLSTRFIELAGEVNVSMPRYVVDKLARALNARKKPVNGSRVLLLGLAYKKDVDDTREAPSFELMHLLRDEGALVDYHDPHVPETPAKRSFPDLQKQLSVPLTRETLAGYDAVLIATDHSAVDYALVAEHAPLIIDTRGVYRAPRQNVVKA
jgi:UDP-N-acetyl-D-glucosamine dehydrogenase